MHKIIIPLFTVISLCGMHKHDNRQTLLLKNIFPQLPSSLLSTYRKKEYCLPITDQIKPMIEQQGSLLEALGKMWKHHYEVPTIDSGTSMKYGVAAESSYSELMQSMEKKKVDQNSEIPKELLQALPSELVYREIVPWVSDNNDDDVAHLLSSMAEKNLGKALECYAHVSSANGLPFMNNAESLQLLHRSPETYVLCARLFHIFKKEPRITNRNELRNRRLSRYEQELLSIYLPDGVKPKINQYEVLPQHSLSHSAFLCIGYTMMTLFYTAAMISFPYNWIYHVQTSSLFFKIMSLMGVYIWNHMDNGFSHAVDGLSFSPLYLPTRLYNVSYSSCRHKPLREIIG